MQVFQAVISKAVELLNLRLTFAPFSFTFGQYLLAIGALSICISFIVHLLDWR